MQLNLKIMQPEFIFFGLWFIASMLIANWGDEKKIGFWKPFFISLFLSPVVGCVCVAVSEDKKSEEPAK